MKFILNKNFKVNKGGIFPLMELPNLSGEKQDWNDFQWWAPTKNFNDWLKKNPRKMQAESSDNSGYSIYSLLESEYSESQGDKPAISFDDFVDQVYEERDFGGAIEDAESSKQYIKFTYALNKAISEGKVSETFSSSSITKDNKAIILSLPDESGQKIEGTEFALKMGSAKTAGNIIIVESNEMLPGGSIPEDTSFKKVLIKFSEFIGKFLSSAIVPTMIVIGGVFAGKAAFRFIKKSTIDLFFKNALGKTPVKKAPGFFSGAFKVFRGTLFKDALKKGPASLRFLKGAKKSWDAAAGLGKIARFGKAMKGGYSALKSAKTAVKAIKAGKAGVQAARVGAGAATAALSTIGVGEVLMLLGAGQQAYNWFSTNQAPRYGEIEGKVPGVSDSFKPGSIPDGQAITVCWTQEAGTTSIGGAVASIFISTDTRTTMDLVKIGNIEGKAIFLLVNINSQQFAKALKESQMIFLAFNPNASFEHGTFDNDDLEFEFIPIKNINDVSYQLIFEGITDWDYLSSTYSKSSSSIIKSDEKAPSSYSFNFKDKAGEIVNVKGALAKTESEIKRFLTEGGKIKKSEKTTSDGENDGEGPKSIFQSAFNLNNNNSGIQKVETGGETAAVNNDSYSFRVRSFDQFILEAEEDEKSDSEESTGGKEGMPLMTGPAEVAVYGVIEASYADKSLNKEYNDIDAFMVLPKYFEAEDGKSIEVEASSEVSETKKGNVTITSKETEIPVSKTEISKKDDENFQKEKPTEDDAKIIDRGEKGTGVSKIKDKDKEDSWNPSQYLSDEEKSELGIKDWEDGVRKVKIYRDDNGKPTMVKIKSYNRLSPDSDERKKNFKEGDPGFEKAVEFAEKVEKELNSEK